ncbi:MAG: DNA methyltransferase [Verrucomicrobiia bacterium]
MTKSYFKEGNFSTGYATHELFPYRGKFHPQLIKGILNILRIQPGDVVLDPMCGSGTLNVEASIIGIDSIGIEKSPFCFLMSKVKYSALTVESTILLSIQKDMYINYKTLISDKKLPADFSYYDGLKPEKAITLLAFMDAMGYARRCSKSIDVLFPSVLKRYVGQINAFIQARNILNLKIGKTRFQIGDAKNLSLENNSIDAIITSPPYSFAIDYAENDRPQLEYLGYNVDELRKEMIGLNGKNKKEKLANYFDDMNQVLGEMHRVLKPNKYAVIIIGSSDSGLANVVILQEDLSHSCIILEVKRPQKTAGLKQLESSCNAIGAQFGFWFDGQEMLMSHREESNLKIPRVPEVTETLRATLTERWNLGWLEEDKDREIIVRSFFDLNKK